MADRPLWGRALQSYFIALQRHDLALPFVERYGPKGDLLSTKNPLDLILLPEEIPKSSFFQLYCEEVFTTKEDTKSTKERKFNRKEAKGRKEFAFQIGRGAPCGCPSNISKFPV